MPSSIPIGRSLKGTVGKGENIGRPTPYKPKGQVSRKGTPAAPVNGPRRKAGPDA